MPIQFRTELILEKNKNQFNYSDSLLCLGSCFATEIGARLKACKFDVCVNPMGIGFHPVSILHHLRQAKKEMEINRFLIQNEDIWHSLIHHSLFSHLEKAAVISKIEKASELLFNKIQNAQFISLTFGTSIVYQHLEKKVIVTNNHKLPGSHFTKKRMSLAETSNNIKACIEIIQEINKSAQIILTVSPVRHLRNGLVENQRSKSTLLLAVAENSNAFNNVTYFPSYEIMMDDLRDYRFYKTDMSHPTDDAVNYIWDKFKETYFDDQEKYLMAKIERIHMAYNHRPFHSKSKDWMQFVESQIIAISEVQKIEPNLDFSKELEHYNSFLR